MSAWSEGLEGLDVKMLVKMMIWLTDIESKLLMDSAHDALLDRPNQFNGKHQLHKANGPTAVSVQDSELIQLIVCD